MASTSSKWVCGKQMAPLSQNISLSGSQKTGPTDGTDTLSWTDFHISTGRTSKLWTVTHSPPTLRPESCTWKGGRGDSDVFCMLPLTPPKQSDVMPPVQTGVTSVILCGYTCVSRVFVTFSLKLQWIF